MTIVPGINHYLDYYKIVVTSGYDRKYVSIMIKDATKDSLRMNNMPINTSHIVFEKYMSAGNAICNVRSIRVEG